MKTRKTEFYIQIVLVILFAYKIIDGIVFGINWPHSYTEFGISDYLINYEGGFVRRGLIGQILYYCFQIHPFPVKTAILGIDLFAIITFFTISIIIFLRKQWSLLPLLFPLACTGSDIVGYRRDFIVALLAFLLFYLYICYIKDHKIWKVIIFVVLSCIAILIYEPIFFLTIPILALFTFYQIKGTFIKRCLFAALPFIFPTITMAAVCLCKGSADQAQLIWNSWAPLFSLFPEKGMSAYIGDGVAFLGRGKSTFLFHISLLLYLGETHTWQVMLSNVLLVISYPMIYFLVTRVPLVNFRKQELLHNTSASTISNIFLIQLLAMSPMLTILSCDLGRTIPLCIYTTYIMVYLLEKNNMVEPIPKKLNSLSIYIQNKIVKHRIVNSFWFYFLILLFVPLRGCFGPKIRNNIFFQVIISYIQKLL